MKNWCVLISADDRSSQDDSYAYPYGPYTKEEAFERAAELAAESELEGSDGVYTSEDGGLIEAVEMNK